MYNGKLNIIKQKMTDNIKSVLITGPPGIGKTTLVKNLIKRMQQDNLQCSGFYTEEIRFDNGRRVGFDVVSIDGKRATLARMFPNDIVERPQVGKYFVYTKEFEKIVLPLLKVTPRTLLIVDEIGKMELLCEPFKRQIDEIFGKTAILATIPMGRRPIDVVERMKADENAIVVEISKKNRNTILKFIYRRVSEMILEENQ